MASIYSVSDPWASFPSCERGFIEAQNKCFGTEEGDMELCGMLVSHIKNGIDILNERIHDRVLYQSQHHYTFMITYWQINFVSGQWYRSSKEVKQISQKEKAAWSLKCYDLILQSRDLIVHWTANRQSVMHSACCSGMLEFSCNHSQLAWTRCVSFLSQTTMTDLCGEMIPSFR